MLKYFERRKSKDGAKTAVAEAPKSPILTDEDEKFLESLTREEDAPPLPERPVVVLDTGAKVTGKDAQEALMDGANNIPLPQSPPAQPETKATVASPEEGKASKKAHDYLSFVRGIPQRFTNKVRTGEKFSVRVLTFIQGKEKEQAGSDLSAAVDAAKKGEIVVADPSAASEKEKEREQDDLTSVLDQLNLSAVNNRAFSFSEKSQEMMAEFTQILKDIVNGVPTAYDDLEKFLKNWDEHLRNMYGDLPPFLQNLVKSLPSKASASIAPGLLAAASEKPGADAKSMGIDTAGSSKTKSKRKIPSLKKLITAEGAVTSMLRSILNFLKLRFPAVITGTNVLMSLAVFCKLMTFTDKASLTQLYSTAVRVLVLP